MKKPKKINVLKETWEAAGGFLYEETKGQPEEEMAIADFDPHGIVDTEIAEARTRLAAQAPEMARLLLKHATYGDGCVECGSSSHSKLSMCSLADTLKAAGIKVK